MNREKFLKVNELNGEAFAVGSLNDEYVPMVGDLPDLVTGIAVNLAGPGGKLIFEQGIHGQPDFLYR